LPSITVEEVLAAHARVKGIPIASAIDHVHRMDLLDSAVTRPQNAAAYEGADLLAQAATLLWGLVRNHPFQDGNKRTALVSTVAFLDINGYRLDMSDDEKFELVLGAGQGRYLDPPPVPPAADVAWIAQNGEDVADLAAHRVRGKVTVIDFGAAWCEPCRQLDEHVIAIAATRSDLAYRKLDIGDWDTPLAKHYLERVPALPYVIVYGKSGHQIDAFSRLDLKRLDRAIEDGAQP